MKTSVLRLRRCEWVATGSGLRPYNRRRLCNRLVSVCCGLYLILATASILNIVSRAHLTNSFGAGNMLTVLSRPDAVRAALKNSTTISSSFNRKSLHRLFVAYAYRTNGRTWSYMTLQDLLVSMPSIISSSSHCSVTVETRLQMHIKLDTVFTLTAN